MNAYDSHLRVNKAVGGAAMKNWLLMLICFLLVGCTNELEINEDTTSDSEYILVDEYLADNPEEKKLSEEFNKYVQNPVYNMFDIKDKKVEIAIVYPGEQVSDYWRRSVDSFRDRMDERNINYKIMEFFTTANESVAVHEQQIRTALLSNPDYLIFTLDTKSHTKIIEQIIDQNQTKIILQNITTPIRRWGSHQPFMYVGFDHKIGSEILAKEYIETFESQSQYGVLYFTEGYVSEMRGDTFIDYMEKNSDFEMIASYYTEGNREKARIAALDMIQSHPKLKFIYACATDVALGAIDAINESGVNGSVLVNGWGGGSAELEVIDSNDMFMTVMRMNDDNGVAMAESIYMDITDRTNKIPTIFSGEFSLIKDSTSEEEINELIKRAFRYSD